MEKGLAPPGGDQNQAAIMITTYAVLTSLSVTIVAVRFIARAVGSNPYGSDDWTMLAALCLSIAVFGIDVSMTRSGLGRHIYYLDISQANRFEKLNFVVELFINLDICVVKISVALFLLRIGGSRRWLRVSLFATIALLVSSTSATIIIIFMQCRPIAGIWDPTLKPTAKCLSASALKDVSYLSAAMSVFTDFLCATLPFQIMWDLQMSRKTKISVLALLCLGSLAMMCGIFRLTLVKGLDSTDSTWNGIALANWSYAECSVGIIAGSIPPCRALILQMLRKFRGETPPNENVIGVPKSPLGRSYQRVTNALSRSRASPRALGGSKGLESSQKKHIPTKLWFGEANRTNSEDGRRNIILPLYNERRASLETRHSEDS